MSSGENHRSVGGLVVVGAGPGPHDLVTLRGRNALRAAQVVYHSPGVSAALLAEAPLEAERLTTSNPRRELDVVIDRVQQGSRVVWLVRGSGEASLDEGDLASALDAAPIRWSFIPGAAADARGARGPLRGRRVLVTRARHQAGTTCQALEDLGAVALAMPTIAIAPPPDRDRLRSTFEQLADYARLVLTSANAVSALRDGLAAVGRDARSLAGLSICAIGPATAGALASLGLRADLVAEAYRAEGLLQMLPAERVAGERILLFRAAEAREVLPQTLRQRGAVVDVVTAYVTSLPAQAEIAPGLAALRAREVDAALFTSGSTVNHFARIVGPQLADLVDGLTVAAIGPITADVCRAVGLPVHVMPEQYTVSALLEALVRYCEHLPSGANGPL